MHEPSGCNVKTLKVRKDSKTGDCYLKLTDFKDLVNIAKVKSYTLEPVDDCNGEETIKSLILKFYDSKGKVIRADGTPK